jgi:hypothetical protein
VSNAANDVQRQRLLDTRARLLHVLGDIAGAAAEQSLTRCPYRTRNDGCTFRGACRNLLTRPHAARGCAGGMLDPTPARPDGAA